MVVPMARALAEETRTAAYWHTVREDDLVAQVEHHRRASEEAHARIERLTADLADATEQRDRARRRVRRLRRRLARSEAPAPGAGWGSRIRRRLRGWSHER